MKKRLELDESRHYYLVEGILTAANLKVTGDVNINGSATAKDFKLAKTVGGGVH